MRGPQLSRGAAPPRAAADGSPVRASRRRLATSRLGWHADNGLRKGDGRGGSQRPGEGALPPRPPAADLVARRTPYDLRRWESAAQALLVRRNATLTIERRSNGAGARPESIRTAPAVTSTPLGATHRRRSRLPGPGWDLGHRFTSGLAPPLAGYEVIQFLCVSLPAHLLTALPAPRFRGRASSRPSLRVRPFLGTAACRALFRQGPSARRLLTEASPPGTPLKDATGDTSRSVTAPQRTAQQKKKDAG